LEALTPRGRWHALRPTMMRAGALIVAVLASLAACGWGGASAVDAQLHDFITRRLPAEPASAQDVVIIDIDEPSLAQIGPWPWPRTVLADMAKRLRERGATVQAWDLYLPETAPGDEALNAVLAAPLKAGQRPDVVLGQVLIADPQVHAPPQVGHLRSTPDFPDLCTPSLPVTGHFGVADSLPAARTGHLSATPDADGGLRSLPAVFCQGTARYPQLTLVAAQTLYPDQPWLLSPGNRLLGPAQWLQRGPMRFALDAQSRIVVPYSRPHHQWTAISALKLLDGSVDPQLIQGKVVVVGATALGLVDTASTPYHPNAPGVSVHAEVLSAALGARWSVVPPLGWPYVTLLTALLGLALLACQRWASRRSVLVVSGLMVLLLPLGVAVLARSAGSLGHILPVASPTLGLAGLAVLLAALHMDAQRRRTHQLTHHLESFLPSHLAREIARQDPSGESLGRTDTGAIMAVRVSGLQRWSAGVGSLKALALVHAITSLAESHARRHGGMLEHVQGDTLLLSWSTTPPEGAHAPQGLTTHDAVHSSVQAARSLLAELGDLLSANETETSPLGLRMAIDHGDFLLAVAGSRTSRRSLMLGAAVDSVLAMLPMCEELASPILMGQRAAQSAPRISMHPMGQFLLPESRTPQTIFRVEP
jgi:adenylate cyclase